MSIGPARHVAGRKHARGARFEVLVDADAAIDRETGLFGECDGRTHADAEHQKVGVDRRTVAQRHCSSIDLRDRAAKMKDDAVFFVNAANDTADLRSHDARERLGLRRDDVHVELAGAERRGNFQTDEARADDHDGCGGCCPRDDRPAVG